MEKQEQTKVFMLCDHKVDYLINNEIVTPLQCGAECSEEDVCELKDNTGDNISYLNPFYLENTGVYWIWKNVNDCKYKGQMQYRRQFRNLKYMNFDLIFDEHDAILADPLDLQKTFSDDNCTVDFHYSVAHNKDDLNLIETILEQKYPEYIDTYNETIKNGHHLLYSCGFILKTEDYNKYCEFMFDIVEEFRQRLGLNTIDDVSKYVYYCYQHGRYPDWTLYPTASEDERHIYQMRIGGSLAERLFTLYAYHNFKNPLYIKYDNFETIKF